jgi:hypothetical protein
MHRLAQVWPLTIDDFALQPMDATEPADFYELVVARHHNTSTVLTSNRGRDDLPAMIRDAPPAAAVDTVYLLKARPSASLSRRLFGLMSVQFCSM